MLHFRYGPMIRPNNGLDESTILEQGMKLMKKTLCIAFLSFILMSLSCVTASAASFKDVPSNYWANKEITWASDRGLMNGTTTTTFNPTGKTLRGQMTAILYRYAGSPAVEQASVYTDVTSAKKECMNLLSTARIMFPLDLLLAPHPLLGARLQEGELR